MMRPWNDFLVVYLCRDVVDFRKGMNGLAALVEDTLQADPFSEQLTLLAVFGERAQLVSVHTSLGMSLPNT